MRNLQSPMSHIKYNLSYWSLSVNSPSRCHLHLSSPPEDGCQGSRLSFEGIPNNNGWGFLAAGQSFSSEASPRGALHVQRSFACSKTSERNMNTEPIACGVFSAEEGNSMKREQASSLEWECLGLFYKLRLGLKPILLYGSQKILLVGFFSPTLHTGMKSCTKFIVNSLNYHPSQSGGKKH